MKKLLAVAALLCVASVATADLQWTVTEVTDADHTGRGLRAFVVSLAGTTDGVDNITAIDGILTGPLSQCWLSGATPTPDAGSPWTILPDPMALKVDTHVMLNLAAPGTIVAKGPTEDSNLPGGKVEDIGMYHRGQGTKLTGPNGVENFAFAFQSGSQPLSADVLMVVIPDGQTAQFRATAVSTEQVGYGIDTPIPVPEPATLGLLAIGGIGALIRRRR